MPPTEQSPAQTPLRLRLPWIIGASALVLYCATFNHWASLSSIGAIARVSGWSWQPELRHLLTAPCLYPFRILPEAWLPFAFTLFTAICAALVVTLLARSVVLLGALGSPSSSGFSRPPSSELVGRGVPAAPSP